MTRRPGASPSSGRAQRADEQPAALDAGEPCRWIDEKGAELPDPYAVLGLPHDAPAALVDARYRERVREHPPERDPEAFKRLSSAYRLLTRPESLLVRTFGRIPRGGEAPPPPAVAEAPPARSVRPFEDELLLYALVHSLRFGAPCAAAPSAPPSAPSR